MRTGCPTNGRQHKRRLAGGDLSRCSPAPTRACAPGARRPAPQYGFLVTHNESISIADYFTRARGRQGGLPPDLPLRLSPLQRRGAVAARDVRRRPARCRRSHHILDENEIVDGIDELGVLLYGHGKNAYWYGSQLSIEETRAHRALPERHRPAGDLGGARRHGLGAGEPEGRHRRGRRDGLPPLPRGAAALSRPGQRRTTPTGRRSKDRPGFFPRTSTRAIPGSSATCWCGELSLRRRASVVAV